MSWEALQGAGIQHNQRPLCQQASTCCLQAWACKPSLQACTDFVML